MCKPMEFKFKKGSMEDLEARVVVASQHVIPFKPKEGTFHLMFGTSDRDAFFERAEEAKLDDDMTHMVVDVSEIEDPDHPWYQIPLPPVETELELQALPERVVLDAGRHYHQYTTSFALSMTMRRYHHHIESLLRSGQLAGTIAPQETYEAFKGGKKEILDHMNFKFINPMIYAKLEGNTQLLERLRGKFMRFFTGAPHEYVDDATQICTKISALHGSFPDTKIVDKLAERLAAVHGEDYETAARLTNELKNAEHTKR
jgi:hypothetical protein